MEKKYKIIFMGTPEFSVPALKALHESRHEISLVITQPDRPKGRGKKLIETPVKEYALKNGYQVYQPEKLNTEESYKKISELSPDFFVVVAFGQILSKKVLSIPKYAPVNIHASLLPKYRGSAPIHRAILNGENKSGITTMLMDVGMDTGDMLLKKETQISSVDTSESLHDRLKEIGAGLIIETLENWDSITPIKQDDSKATHAPMLSKKEGEIDWTLSSEKLDCLVRGMTPWPGTYTFHNNKRFKVFTLKVLDEKTENKPGTVLRCDDKLVIATGNGAVEIIEIQGASGKRMKSCDFLRGYKIETGDIFGFEK